MTDIRPFVHLEFEYTNWQGEHETRRVCVHRIEWTATEYHRQPQFILFGHCMDRRQDRGFAMRDMSNVRSWSPISQGAPDHGR